MARAYFEDGRASYEAGRFADAAEQFEQAYRLTHRDALLYNIYLAYRDLGDDAHAADALRRYLATLAADAPDRQRLEARLAVHEQRAAEQAALHHGESRDHDASGGDSTGPAAAGSDDGGASEPGGGGPGLAPWLLIGAGGALVVGGLVVGGLALGKKSELDDLCPTMTTCNPGFDDVRSEGQTLAVVSDVLWITGAAAAATGLVLAIVSLAGGDDEGPAPTASFACTADGCRAAVRGRF